MNNTELAKKLREIVDAIDEHFKEEVRRLKIRKLNQEPRPSNDDPGTFEPTDAQRRCPNPGCRGEGRKNWPKGTMGEGIWIYCPVCMMRGATVHSFVGQTEADAWRAWAALRHDSDVVSAERHGFECGRFICDDIWFDDDS